MAFVDLPLSARDILAHTISLDWLLTKDRYSGLSTSERIHRYKLGVLMSCRWCGSD